MAAIMHPEIATPETMRMLFQAISSNYNGSQPNKPRTKYSELNSSSMMPTRITTVLKVALAGFLFMQVPDAIFLALLLQNKPVSEVTTETGRGCTRHITCTRDGACQKISWVK